MGPKLQAFCQAFADACSVPPHSVHRVLIANMTYLGHRHVPATMDLARMIKTELTACPHQNVALVIFPNIGQFGEAFTEDGVAKAVAAVKTTFTDDLYNLECRELSFVWDEQTMYSPTRAGAHQGLMCFLKPDPGVPASPYVFKKSSLWVRRAIAKPVQVHPRSEFVDPHSSALVASDANLAAGRELRQHVTGMDMYDSLIRACFKGTGLSRSDLVMLADLCPYDATLPKTALNLVAAHNQGQGIPVLACSSLSWTQATGVPQANARGIAFLHKNLRMHLLGMVRSKAISLPSLPPGIMATVAAPGPRPTYDEAEFKVTMPRQDGTLPIRQTVHDEWADQDFAEQFHVLVMAHNAEWNASGVPFKATPESQKRVAEPTAESLEASTAVSLPPVEGGKEKIVADNPGAVHCVLGFDSGFELIHTGKKELYIHALRDIVVSSDHALCCMGGGEYETKEAGIALMADRQGPSLRPAGPAQQGCLPSRCVCPGFHPSFGRAQARSGSSSSWRTTRRSSLSSPILSRPCSLRSPCPPSPSGISCATSRSRTSSQ